MLIETKQFIKPHATKAIIFLCPYNVPITKMRWPIRSLQRAGYSVIAIGYPTGIFNTGDPTKLTDAIAQTAKYIKETISALQKNSYTEFGFVGSSLGGFAIYNNLGDIPELSWGVVIAGGDITKAVWSFDAERQKFIANGFTRESLAASWHDLQYPELGNLKTKRYIMVTSKGDKTAGYSAAAECVDRIKAAGAQAKLITHRKLNHRQTVIRNLARTRSLVRQARK